MINKLLGSIASKLRDLGGFRNLRGLFFLDLAVLTTSLGFFFLIFLLKIPTDIQDHVYYLKLMLAGDHYLANFLFYLAVWALAFFQSNPYMLIGACILVLGASIWLKFRISLAFLIKFQNPRKTISPLTLPLTLTLLTATCLPGPKNFVIGQFSPTLWHNSTLIFLMPFVLILFWQSVRFLQNPSLKLALWMSLFSVLGVLVKPSFFFCFGVVFPLFSLARFGLKKTFWWSLIPVVLGAAFTLGEFWFIYLQNSYSSVAPDTSGITIAPFHVWQHHSPNLLWSLLASIAFPLSLLFAYPQQAFKSLWLRYSWALMAVSLLIFILLTETGPREYDCNFAWQAYISNYLLFLVSAANWMKWQTWRAKDKVVLGVLGLHVLAGLCYLGRILLDGNYY